MSTGIKGKIAKDLDVIERDWPLIKAALDAVSICERENEENGCLMFIQDLRTRDPSWDSWSLR